MERHIELELAEWQQQPKRLPLLIRGPRQVGKSYIVQKFAQTHFEHYVEVNFEFKPGLKQYFNTLDPNLIITKLEYSLGVPIIPGKTLLFLDEIQDCPSALMALRYFKEKMPELHVIAAGSLLEFLLQNEQLRMPVGRVQYMYMLPMTYKGFLRALGELKLIDYIENVSFGTEFDPFLHNKLLDYVRLFFVIGGMPAVVENYLDNRNLAQAQQMQLVILNTYRDDFGKYAGRTNHQHMETLFIKAPELVTRQFKYVDVSRELQARDVKKCLGLLSKAGLVHQIFSSKATGLPLNALLNEKYFKLLFLDIGLLMAATEIDGDVLLAEDLNLVNRGALSEQFVGQELLANQNLYREPNLCYWHREQPSSAAEVDYVINVGSQIIPIEVKSGSTGRLRSLKIFMEDRDLELGIRLSQKPLEREGSIISVPFYLVSELKRLLGSV